MQRVGVVDSGASGSIQHQRSIKTLLPELQFLPWNKLWRRFAFSFSTFLSSSAWYLRLSNRFALTIFLFPYRRHGSGAQNTWTSWEKFFIACGPVAAPLYGFNLIYQSGEHSVKVEKVRVKCGFYLRTPAASTFMFCTYPAVVKVNN
jgi:hypothetical protein